MSSGAAKVSKKIRTQRISVLCQVLTLMEEEAKKKGFFKRLHICFRYLFLRKFDAFFN